MRFIPQTKVWGFLAWVYIKESPPDDNKFVSIAENISDINDYSIIHSSEWYYVNGFYNDWMYEEHNNILHFCLELAPTDADDPRDTTENEPILELCKTHLLVNIYLAEQALAL